MAMKTFIASVLIVACSALAGVTAYQDNKHSKETGQGSGNTMTAAEAMSAGGGRIKRGEPIGKSPAVAFADVLKDPAKFAGKRVRIEGVVERVCKMQGCWMQIAPKAGAAGVRVSFLDHKFFVPKDSERLNFMAEGEFSVKVLSKEEADHLVEDGAKLARNADGTSDEISFVATGVELWK